MSDNAKQVELRSADGTRTLFVDRETWASAGEPATIEAFHANRAKGEEPKQPDDDAPPITIPDRPVTPPPSPPSEAPPATD